MFLSWAAFIFLHGRNSSLVIALWICLVTQSQAGTITIFAAASLTSVVTELAQEFEAETGTRCRISFASSSVLARQIEAGAPADLYLSANVKWMDYLIDRSMINQSRQNRQISNQLVLVAPKHLNLKRLDAPTIETIEKALGRDGLLTMGDPDHVPVGLYGKAALEAFGLWETLKNRIARADNATAAIALVERGETPLGIVYRTDAMNLDQIDILYSFDATQTPIQYAIALTSRADGNSAEAFYDFLVGDRGLALFEKHGFVILPK